MTKSVIFSCHLILHTTLLRPIERAELCSQALASFSSLANDWVAGDDKAIQGVVHSHSNAFATEGNVCRTFWCISVCHLLNHTLFSHSQPQIQPRSLVQGHTALRSVPSPSNPRLPTHLVSATRSTPAHSSLRSQNREQPPVHNLFSCFVLIFLYIHLPKMCCWLTGSMHLVL